MAYEYLIGQEGILDVAATAPAPQDQHKTFSLLVRILDVRKVYGRTEFLVRPALTADTPQWVSRERVRVAP